VGLLQRGYQRWLALHERQLTLMSHGSFSGDPQTLWLTENEIPDRKMQMLADFSFTDPAGVVWLTPKDYVVDGASIPRAFWTLVGSPYTGDYRRASIVHDKACDHASGNTSACRKAHRMFYHACRAGGCSIPEATLLYIGVRIGDVWPLVPAWSPLIAAPEGPLYEKTPTDQRIEADFRLIAQQVLAQPESDDPVEIEARTDRALRTTIGLTAVSQ
jgi:hypothetical protein